MIDALVLVAPISMICVGLIWASLSKKPFHTTSLFLAAPLSGFLVSVVYHWDNAQSLVIPLSIAALLVTLSAWLAALIGYRCIQLNQEPEQQDESQR